MHCLSTSKRGMSAHRRHRMLGITDMTAWFMAHRIREAMCEPKPGPPGVRKGFKGGNGTVNHSIEE